MKIRKVYPLEEKPMAMNKLFSKMIHGSDKDDDYARSTLPSNRFSLFWDVLKSNFFKLMGVNLIIILTFVPLFILFVMRYTNLLANAARIPFSANIGIGFPVVPLPAGQTELVSLASNRWFCILLPFALLFASCGLAGGLYVIRNLVWTEGVLVISDLWRGFKQNIKSVLPVCFVFGVFAALLTFAADYLGYLYAIGWGTTWLVAVARTICYILLAYLFLIAMYMLSMGVTYNLGFFRLLHNAFIFSYALIFTNIAFLFLAILPFLLLLILPLNAIYVFLIMLVLMIGFSYALLVWTDYTQWAFDKFINPRIDGAKVGRGIYKKNGKPASGAESAAFEQYRKQKAEVLKLLADDHLVSTPIKPIDDDIVVDALPEHYTRADLERLQEQKQRMIDDANAWAEEHKNDEKYRVFTEMKEGNAKADDERQKKLDSYKKAEEKRKRKKK